MIIGNRYYWEDYECGGWNEIDKKTHDILQAARDDFNRRLQVLMAAHGTPMPPPMVINTMAPLPEDYTEFKDIWMESADGTKSKLTSYFTPAIQPLIDKYGNEKSN